jgi:hypothetical protein
MMWRELNFFYSNENDMDIDEPIPERRGPPRRLLFDPQTEVMASVSALI